MARADVPACLPACRRPRLQLDLMHLPVAWAYGFPVLRELTLAAVGPVIGIPLGWETSGFPELVEL